MTAINDDLQSSESHLAAELAMINHTERAVASTYPNARSSFGSISNSKFVRNPANQNGILFDQKGRPVTIDRILATKPLRQELSTRPGPGNRRLTYISGDGVSRSLNEIFGYEGWSLDIKSVNQTGKEQDKRGRWQVSYLAHVRITLTANGAYKEDMGSGDSIDNNLQTAVSHAMKASITDALKRAARHFGDKLGNSLYDADFAINKAPTDLFEALDEYERCARAKWGSSNVPAACGENQGHCNSASKNAEVTTKMPPPRPPAIAAPSTVNHSHPVPLVTPNNNASCKQPGNVYQRHSLGSLPSGASVCSIGSSYATPRVSVDPTTPAYTGHGSLPNNESRPILSETSVAVNSAPPTAAQSMQNLFQAAPENEYQPFSVERPPLARPIASWGNKRPGGETVETAKRPRHNPYA